MSLGRRRVLRCATSLAAAVAGLSVDIAHAAERVLHLRIQQRRIENGGGTLRVTVGDQVELHWRTDEATTIHLHGYDLTLALDPAKEARMRFEASATGRYPIGAHGFGAAAGHASHREVVLLYLEVHPR